MYGLVNRAIKELISESHGPDTWARVAGKAGVDPSGFIDLESYSDDITYALVRAASEELGDSQENLLHAFGKHWVLYTGSAEWGYLFDLAGSDFLTFLQGLDNLHARVEATMPESRMPQFTVVEHPDHVELQYHSHREGLAPMVHGLLEGLLDRFDESWIIEPTVSRSAEGYDGFALRQAGQKENARAA